MMPESILSLRPGRTDRSYIHCSLKRHTTLLLAYTATMLDCSVDNTSRVELVPNTRDPRYDMLDNKLLNQGLVTTYRGDLYIFLVASNYWSNLSSDEAKIQINGIVGNGNVSVNYDTSTKPFIDYLERHSRRVPYIPMSICVGARRLSMCVDENTLVYGDVGEVTEVPKDLGIHPVVSTFSTYSSSIDVYPNRWTREGLTKLEAFLLPLFSDRRELDTLKWILGGVMIDPVYQSKMVMLYGEGGTGKSTILRVLDILFKGCSGSVPTGVFIGRKSDPPDSALAQASSRRILVCGELDLLNNPLNMHTIKYLTGGDRVSIGVVRATTRSTIVCATNYLPTLETEKEWYTSQILRRIVVQPFDTNAREIPPAEIPDASEDLMDFMQETLLFRLQSKVMPVTLRTLLLTILGGSYYIVAGYVIEDDSSTVQEIIDANSVIESNLQLESCSLGKRANDVTTHLTTYIYGMPYIGNMRLASSRVE